MIFLVPQYVFFKLGICSFQCHGSWGDIHEMILIIFNFVFDRQTKNMAGGQVIRKMFPRPEFVPAESEVALEKTVFLDGPKTDHYELVSIMLMVFKFCGIRDARCPRHRFVIYCSLLLPAPNIFMPLGWGNLMFGSFVCVFVCNSLPFL